MKWGYKIKFIFLSISLFLNHFENAQAVDAKQVYLAETVKEFKVMEDAVKTTGEIQSCKVKNVEIEKPIFNLPKEEDCSNPNLEISSRDQEAITKAFDQLKSLKEKDPNYNHSQVFASQLEIVISELDKKLSSSGKTFFMKKFLEEHDQELSENARKAVVDHPLYKEFRQAQLNWDQKVGELKVWNKAYKNGYGTFDAFSGGPQNELSEIQNSLKDLTKKLVSISERLQNHPQTNSDSKEKMNSFLYQVYKTNMSAYGDASSVYRNADKVIEGEIQATKTAAALAASLVVTGGASGLLASSAGAGRIALLVGQGIKGGSAAYAISLSAETSKEFFKASASGKDISCEFAHKLAEKGPEMRYTALKTGMMAALIGAGVGALILKGGVVAATGMTTAKIASVVFSVKSIAGATSAGIKSSEDFDKAIQLLKEAIDTGNSKLEAEARKQLENAKDQAVDAGFEGIGGVAQSWAAVKNAKSLYEDILKNREKIISIFSKKPSPTI